MRVVAPVTVNVQVVDVPAQGALQPPNSDPGAGLAVNVITVPSTICAVQVGWQ